MMKLTAVFGLMLLSASTFAAEAPVCAAITHCDTVQTKRSDHKKSTFKNSLKLDQLCDSDEPALPLKGGEELSLKIVKKKLVVELFAPGRASKLASKSVGLQSEKVSLSHKTKDASTSVTCAK